MHLQPYGRSESKSVQSRGSESYHRVSETYHRAYETYHADSNTYKRGAETFHRESINYPDRQDSCMKQLGTNCEQTMTSVEGHPKQQRKVREGEHVYALPGKYTMGMSERHQPPPGGSFQVVEVLPDGIQCKIQQGPTQIVTERSNLRRVQRYSRGDY